MIAKTNFKPIDKVFLSMPQPLTDEIITEGGLKLYLDSSYNPEIHATVSGIVEALPENPKSKGKEIVSQLKVGDEVAFNYKVVIDKKYTPNTDKFEAVTDNPAKKIFINKKGERIIVQSLPYKGVLHWVGMYLDRKGERVDGVQGREKDVDRWLSQFDFSTDIKFVYKNLINYDDIDIWKCDYINIYAKKTADGIQALGDMVIMKEIKVDITEQVKIMKGIVIPNNRIIAELQDRAIVVSGGEIYGLSKGDRVFFDPLYVERYNFFGEEYLIIKQRRIHSIESKMN